MLQEKEDHLRCFVTEFSRLCPKLGPLLFLRVCDRISKSSESMWPVIEWIAVRKSKG